ncbi:hypothetical protein K402DRAFT_410101 [Aulographum hederae CBS 113979]|uniref:Histone-lysine N-methyltransferase, H3 lysine-36 specific n=1 Tax=Aulographum hederae CBS 113979 TaxID=1176131 RepID=A0A6G1HBK2_9PEZI|nr:hypothetical protein K402DRAFT_410101 [Aulographum hederae CBS 113979]
MAITEPSAADGEGALVKSDGQEPQLQPPTPPRKSSSGSSSQSSVEHPGSTTQSPTTSSPPLSANAEQEETIGGDITVKMEPGKTPKLTRTTSQKVIARPPPLFSEWPNKTEEATSTFEVIRDCTYGNKYMGSTDHALECDCAEEWNPLTHINDACGEDSDCINRATKMECVGDCGCGADCQNQRFQQKQYANVSVIKTEKKGYGLRADFDLHANDFIFEYIGEVINEGHFKRRMIQYDEEGIKHFYFMSLSKGEFVDATKKGNLGRFCNHSCNPNCYVDKWVVGDKLRMGIFAERHIKAGEELVFNYNVDRYGADPQPCYCGEPNCTGYIGGKTQTERATKLSNLTIEALGIDDGDGWDLAVARKPRKKKAGEDDEEYVNNVTPKSLEEESVTKVMATLMQCKEKWIVVKLLNRVQRADSDGVRNRVVKMHGYVIFKTILTTFLEDDNVVLQVLNILENLPRITRNKIQDSKIEEVVEQCKASENEEVSVRATTLLDIWGKLEVGYRIPRVKRDPNAAPTARPGRFDRRESKRDRSRSRSRSPPTPRGPSAAPSGPRTSFGQRGGWHGSGPRPFPRRFQPPPAPGVAEALPVGWHKANTIGGQPYYYNDAREVRWSPPQHTQIPTATLPPPPPPRKDQSKQQAIQDLIKSITSAPDTRVSNSASSTPQPSQSKDGRSKDKEPSWKKLPLEKQMKMYEGTVAKVITAYASRYKDKIEREELKRFTKQLCQKIVKGDFQKHRVKDVTQVAEDSLRPMKKLAKGWFESAVRKSNERKARKSKDATTAESTTPLGSPMRDTPEDTPAAMDEPYDDESMAGMSSLRSPEMAGLTSLRSPLGLSPPNRKRKRESESMIAEGPADESDSSILKKAKTGAPPPPPPPPPPFPPSDENLTFDNEGHAMTDPEMAMAEEAAGTSEHPSAYRTSAVLDKHYINDAKKNGNGHIVEAEANGHPSPMQLATPSTNGSYELDKEKDAKKKKEDMYAGMNPARLKQLET